LIVVRQGNPAFDPTTVTDVTIEFAPSVTTGHWNLIRAIPGVDENPGVVDPNEWQALWDTEAVAPGRYFVRATLAFTVNAEPQTVFVTKRVLVDKPPTIGVISVSPGSDTGVVVFDGNDVTDVDGRVTGWTWDFGDPFANRGCDHRGAIESARYPDTGRKYGVRLKIRDNKRVETSGYYDLQFVADTPQMQPATKCICKSIKVRASGVALGPKGDRSRAWGATAHHDGKTLGPLDGNPGNRADAAGEKGRAGYAFEILAEIDGDPAKCGETQLTKRTVTLPDGKVQNSSYNGKADRDLDGTEDIDGTTEAGCAAAGGQWTNNRCEFPQSGYAYMPDGRPEHNGSIYNKPYTHKARPDGKIIWWDAPSGVVPNDATYRADFVSIVRGTDQKYCYVFFRVVWTRKAGKDDEAISPSPVNGEIVGVTGADTVPEVPLPE
jgi:hypothetical protein